MSEDDTITDLSQPFTVEWLCEIGFERDEQYDHIRIVVPREHTTNAVTYLILTDPENATDSPWDMRTIYDDGTQEAVMVAEQITTRGDVLKWLDVLGIEVKQTT